LSRKYIYGGPSNPHINVIVSDYVSALVAEGRSDWGPCGTMGIVLDGVLSGAVVFHNWMEQYGTMEISCAATDPRWLTKETIRNCLSVCFDQHKCQQIFSRVAPDNLRTLKIWDFVGFKRLELPNMLGKNKPEILMYFTDDDWAVNQLNKERHGQKNPSESA
jgi:RimJ/RimL family protein N-acetyltransferase